MMWGGDDALPPHTHTLVIPRVHLEEMQLQTSGNQIFNDFVTGGLQSILLLHCIFKDS